MSKIITPTETNMKKHSKGAWAISRHATPEHSPQFGIYSGDSPNDLATVKGENAAANATLISAAPTMLAALEMVEQWLLRAPDVLISATACREMLHEIFQQRRVISDAVQLAVDIPNEI
jgi:hypothetical protein